MEMVLLISILSLIFIGIGTLITEKNAAYLLSGYNTMSKEKQEQVDLKELLRFSKKLPLSTGRCLLTAKIECYHIGQPHGRGCQM